MTLQPLHGSAAASFAYFGKRDGWLIALSQHRHSHALDRSNWRVIVPDMLAAYPDDAAVESMTHWAVGWIEYLLVRPGTPAADAAQTWADKLADYPAADDSDFSDLEYAEEWCVRCDRGTREDHPLNGCTFRSADDADNIRFRWEQRDPPEHGYRSRTIGDDGFWPEIL